MRWPLALLVALVGCGDEAAKPPAPDQPSGKVISVEGSVTATRPRSRPRPVRVGTIIRGEDTITTEDSASVTIRLAHNGVELALGAGEQRRVDQSSAWTASGKVVEGLLDRGEVDRTSAAGSHTERLAAQDQAELEPKTEAPEPDPVTAANDVDHPVAAVPGSDEKAPVTDRAKKPKSGGQRFDARRVRRRITQIVKACGADTKTAGKISVAITLGVDGRASPISVIASGDKLAPVARCAEERLGVATFPKPASPVRLAIKVAFQGT